MSRRAPLEPQPQARGERHEQQCDARDAAAEAEPYLRHERREEATRQLVTLCGQGRAGRAGQAGRREGRPEKGKGKGNDKGKKGKWW